MRPKAQPSIPHHAQWLFHPFGDKSATSVMDNKSGYYSRLVGNVQWVPLADVLKAMGVKEGENFYLLRDGRAYTHKNDPDMLYPCQELEP